MARPQAKMHSLKVFRPNLYASEILKYLLEAFKGTATGNRSTLINHRNHSGNTPLHWAALNVHPECVKALVEAGADIDAKNDAGHDAAFLAERSEWGTAGEDEAEGNPTDEATADAATSGPPQPMSKAMQVVEYLLTYDRGTESGPSGPNNENGDEMEGVETGTN